MVVLEADRVASLFVAGQTGRAHDIAHRFADQARSALAKGAEEFKQPKERLMVLRR